MPCGILIPQKMIAYEQLLTSFRNQNRERPTKRRDWFCRIASRLQKQYQQRKRRLWSLKRRRTGWSCNQVKVYRGQGRLRSSEHRATVSGTMYSDRRQKCLFQDLRCCVGLDILQYLESSHSILGLIPTLKPQTTQETLY